MRERAQRVKRFSIYSIVYTNRQYTKHHACTFINAFARWKEGGEHAARAFAVRLRVMMLVLLPLLLLPLSLLLLRM